KYAGTGDLRNWIRVTAHRMLLRIAKQETKEAPTSRPFFEAIGDIGLSTEPSYVRSEGQEDVRNALVSGAARLSARDRCLLRYTYGDRRTVQQIGTIYGVHGATASRWVEKARQRLLLLVQEELTTRLAISQGEAASILRGALSRIDLTLSTI